MRTWDDLKKRKIVVAIILCLVQYVCALTPLHVNAAEKEWIVVNLSTEHTYLKNTKTGEMVVEAWKYDDMGKIVKVDLSEYAVVLNEEVNEKTICKDESNNFKKDDNNLEASVNTKAISPVCIASYTKISTSKVNGKSQKVSPDVKGKASITYGNTCTVSETFSISGKAASDMAKKKIRAEAGFTWTKSVSTNSSFSVSYSVPKGKTGYVKFTPKMNKTTGTYRERIYFENRLMSDESHPATATSPIKLSNGFADGTYALVLK